MARKKKSVEGSTPARTLEQKQAKFAELASKRVSKALKAMEQVCFLANPNVYVYTPDQVERIKEALQSGLTRVSSSFADPKSSKSGGFIL